MPKQQAEQVFDIIIAGGGLAGTLAAARLAKLAPGKKIALLEKDPALGGRLKATSLEDKIYGYGLNAISDPLFELWNQTLKGDDPEAQDLSALVQRRQGDVGVLAGNKMGQIGIDLWFTPKGARVLGGYTAQKQWAEVEEIVRKGASAKAEDDDEEEVEAAEGEGEEAKAKPEGAKAHHFGHYWSKPRKVPAAVVLEHYGSAYGIPDVWSAAPQAIGERASQHSGRLHCGVWDDALKALTELPEFKAAVSVFTSCRVVDAAKEGDDWVVEAEAGTYRAKTLVVAQSPWQAVGWLPRALWPTTLLQVALKTKPVSVVVLSEKLIAKDAVFPDVVLVPSEKVQIVRNGENEICFQCTIDYELSLQAPAVVKAVKQLKRARKKLQTLYPGLVTEGNHIALQPVAWAQSPLQSDRRWIEKAGKKSYNTKELAFVGDAYGTAYDGDQNLTRSLGAAVEAVLS